MMADVTKGLAGFSFIIGTALKYTGAALLLIMAVVGTLSLDILILLVVFKESSRSNNSHPFLTGFILGSMFNGPRHHDHNPSSLGIVGFFASSLIITAVAVLLAFFVFNMPAFAMILIAGWVIAAGTALIGVALQSLAETIHPDVEKDVSALFGDNANEEIPAPGNDNNHINEHKTSLGNNLGNNFVLVPGEPESLEPTNPVHTDPRLRTNSYSFWQSDLDDALQPGSPDFQESANQGEIQGEAHGEPLTELAL